MLRSRWPLLALGALLLFAAGALWGARRYQMAAPTSNAYTQIREMPSPLTGHPAPSFTLPLAGGGKAGPADFRGKTVILAFWSSF
jgi:hypothetical protein